MPIPFDCGCGRRLRVPDRLAGKRAKCPGCGALLDLPLAQGTAITRDVSDLVEAPAAHIPHLQGALPVTVPPRKKKPIPVAHWFIGAGILATTVVIIVLIRQAKSGGDGDDGEVAARRTQPDTTGDLAGRRGIGPAYAAPGTPASVTWSEFTSAEGGFSVLMPGTPVQHAQSMPTRFGNLELHMFGVRINQAEYIVTYCDYPGDAWPASDANSLLDAFRDNIVTRNGRVLREQDISLEGYPGRGFHFAAAPPLPNAVAHVRLCLVGRRLYAVLGSVPQGAGSTDAERFLDSFRLTEPVAELAVWTSDPAFAEQLGPEQDLPDNPTYRFQPPAGYELLQVPGADQTVWMRPPRRDGSVAMLSLSASPTARANDLQGKLAAFLAGLQSTMSPGVTLEREEREEEGLVNGMRFIRVTIRSVETSSARGPSGFVYVGVDGETSIIACFLDVESHVDQERPLTEASVLTVRPAP